MDKDQKIEVEVNKNEEIPQYDGSNDIEQMPEDELEDLVK